MLLPPSRPCESVGFESSKGANDDAAAQKAHREDATMTTLIRCLGREGSKTKMKRRARHYNSPQKYHTTRHDVQVQRSYSGNIRYSLSSTTSQNRPMPSLLSPRESPNPSLCSTATLVTARLPILPIPNAVHQERDFYHSFELIKVGILAKKEALSALSTHPLAGPSRMPLWPASARMPSSWREKLCKYGLTAARKRRTGKKVGDGDLGGQWRFASRRNRERQA
ncbi:6853_t:CDS:2 [Acaulospora colombiana]|uniref:6853_t:CDS:1 n=1 Tax=Acaulospora colombiana TaxID=27376 RepID=A0ACA9PL72_9GLOM|nr:6853_t:CDS:2 [Acaulospora colombiana]